MILGAFGDSFLYGSDLKDCDDKHHSLSTWPAIAAKKLDLEYKCYAYPGVGNQYIANSIIDCVSTHRANIVYIINWTWIDRFDYIDNINSSWNTVRPSLDNKTVDEFYYKNFHSELKDKLSNLEHVYTTLSILKEHNCKFLMTYMDHLILDQKWHCTPGVNLLQNSVYSSLETFNGNTFLEWSRKHKFAESEKWHPLEEAHQHAAKYWLPRYEKLLLSTSV